MRVLKGTLTFVLGMVIGIILFVVAIGGTVAILATQMTVGQIQQAITGSDDIISSDSEIYDKTILDAVKDIVNDVQNFDKLSLKTLYEHYGIKLLNGISGIDFTNKDFYTVPIPELVGDLSIVVNSFTLNDVSKIAGVDFASYGLPILTDNLNNNLSTAMDNILGSLNGNLTIRDINTNFGIDIGIDDNPLLGTLQDVVLSEFGNVMTVMRVSSILEADTDTFVPYDTKEIKRFKKADRYEQIPASELASGAPALGVETSLIGGEDTDGDGKADKMRLVETRYVEEIFDEDGSEVTKYVVDNSSYAADFDFENNKKTFYRHIEYVPADGTTGADELYVLGYANRIDSISGEDYTLVEKGFFLESELEFGADKWAMTGDVLNKDSKLALLEEGETAEKSFIRVIVGKSTTMLQTIANMTVGDLQDADNLLDGMTVGDVIEITPDSAKIMKSLVARGCKITELGEAANDLTLGEMIDITTYKYKECENGELGRYVRIVDEKSYTLYEKDNPDFNGLPRYKKDSNGEFVEDSNGKFVNSVYYTLYNPAEHAGFTLYNREALGDGEAVSSALLQRFMGATLSGFSNAFDSLMLADVMQIDADVYAAVTPEYIAAHKDERYFYYDSANSIYRIANAEYIDKNPDATIYHITHSGEGTSFLKKLAYVKVDKMADAMNLIIDDMMLTEILDIYEYSAVELAPNNGASANPENDYFIESQDGSGFAYVYDKKGEYVKANYRPVLIPIPEKPEDNNTTPLTYKYASVSDLLDGLNDAEAKEKQAELFAQNNLFCKKADYVEGTPLKDEVFMRNRVLAEYMLTQEKHKDNVYYRVKVEPTGADDEMTVQMREVAAQANGVYIRDEVGGYIKYSTSNPAFAGLPLYTFERADSNVFFIKDSEVLKMTIALSGNLTHDENHKYARKVCEDVYVKIASPDSVSGEQVYVYIDGRYDKYDAERDVNAEKFFIKKVGYLGKVDEFFDESGNTEFDLYIANYIYKRSAPVLRLLAKGTLAEMPDIIAEAKIGDIVEADPDSLFAKDEIKKTKLTDLGSAFRNILTDMTIGELMTWSNASMSPAVKTALEDISIQSLFSSFTIGEDKEIKIDMLKLYGYETKAETPAA